MLSQDTMDTITELVAKMANNDEMFTAFDVTSIIRKTEDGEAPHHEVKNIVHSMFGNGEMPSDYQRSSSSFKLDNGGSVTVFVYHPQWLNPGDYNPKRFQEEDGNPFLSKTAASPAVKTVGDKRGRVCVPACIVREFGSTFGDSVWVDNTLTGSIHIYPTLFDDAKEYKVDRSGNIRLAKSIVDKCKFISKPNFNVEHDQMGAFIHIR